MHPLHNVAHFLHFFNPCTALLTRLGETSADGPAYLGVIRSHTFCFPSFGTLFLHIFENSRPAFTLLNALLGETSMDGTAY